METHVGIIVSSAPLVSIFRAAVALNHGTSRKRRSLVKSPHVIAQAVLLIYIAVIVPYRIGFDDDTKPYAPPLLLLSC